MQFTPIPCHETLRPFIRNYWQITAHCTSRGTQQVLSNGAASLHFYISQAVKLNDGERTYRTVLFHQNMKSVGIVTEEGPVVIFGVEFVPFCSKLFFDMDTKSEHVTPSGLHDDAFSSLSTAIHEAESTDERVQMLDDFFLHRLSDFPADDVNIERLQDVFDEIVPVDGADVHRPKNRDSYSPSDLASTACLSQKQFTRVFNKYVGMNPKSYLRLLRFHKTLMQLQRSADSVSLTDIAWSCGYYDLAHMTADFKAICGYTPSGLINSAGELTETFGQQFSGLMKKKIRIENLI